jgi:hypothetical protein
VAQWYVSVNVAIGLVQGWGSPEEEPYKDLHLGAVMSLEILGRIRGALRS